jgi:hypothetical protein
MPEVWEQEAHVRAGTYFRGDFQEELKKRTTAPSTTRQSYVLAEVQARPPKVFCTLSLR